MFINILAAIPWSFAVTIGSGWGWGRCGLLAFHDLHRVQTHPAQLCSSSRTHTHSPVHTHIHTGTHSLLYVWHNRHNCSPERLRLKWCAWSTDTRTPDLTHTPECPGRVVLRLLLGWFLSVCRGVVLVPCLWFVCACVSVVLNPLSSVALSVCCLWWRGWFVFPPLSLSNLSLPLPHGWLTL